jgi:hypothetical protein
MSGDYKIRLSFDKCHRVAGDSLTAACEAQAVGGGRFHAHLSNIEQELLRQVDAYGLDMG